MPSAIFRPKSMTTTMWEMAITIDMWCSTSKMVRSNSSRMCLMVSPSSSTSPWVRPLAGSSSSSSFGREARARANSRRLSVPNGRPNAGRSARWPSDIRSRISRHSVRRRFSSLADPMRSIDGMNPTLPSVWAPTITFSSTVSAGNSARFWNVRATPILAILCGGSASRSWPSKVTCPLCAS